MIEGKTNRYKSKISHPSGTMKRDGNPPTTLSKGIIYLYGGEMSLRKWRALS